MGNLTKYFNNGWGDFEPNQNIKLKDYFITLVFLSIWLLIFYYLYTNASPSLFLSILSFFIGLLIPFMVHRHFKFQFHPVIYIIIALFLTVIAIYLWKYTVYWENYVPPNTPLFSYYIIPLILTTLWLAIYTSGGKRYTIKKRVKYLLDKSSIVTNDDIIENLNFFIKSGEKGLLELIQLSKAAFDVRPNMDHLITLNIEIAKTIQHNEIINLLENIAFNASKLCYGQPVPPPWMDSMRPIMVGENKYGWDDSTWIFNSHRICDNLIHIIKGLPNDVYQMHRLNIINISNHYIEEFEKEFPHYNEFKDKEIKYWQKIIESVNN